MTKFQSLFIAATTALFALSGTMVPVSAQETRASLMLNGSPFDVSHAKCVEIEFRWCGTMTVPGVTVREFAASIDLLASNVLRANGWSEEMLDEEIPVGKFFLGSSGT